MARLAPWGNGVQRLHREECLEAARRHAAMRHDSMTLLNNPKEDIEILLPELVKIKENIF